MVDEPRTEVFKRRILFCKFQAKPRSVCYRAQMARRDSSAKPQAKDPITLGIFARRLGESMTARRLSALQVAEGAGVDERTIAMWLAAEVEPQLFRPLRPPPGGPDPPERAGDHRGGGAGPGRLEPLEGRNGRAPPPRRLAGRQGARGGARCPPRLPAGLEQLWIGAVFPRQRTCVCTAQTRADLDLTHEL